MADRVLRVLSQEDLDHIVRITSDGSIALDVDYLAAAVASQLGLQNLCVAVSDADYLLQKDASPEPNTRRLQGIWWEPTGGDKAVVGGFTIDGRAMSISTEGECDAPIAESSVVVKKATRAIASQYEGAELVGLGLFAVPGPAGEMLTRVVVTRDHRVRRPQDLLGPDELVQFQSARLALVIVQLIGGDKALVVKHGL